MKTVQELINALQKVKNKNQRIVVSNDLRNVFADIVKLYQRKDALVIEIDENAYGGKIEFKIGI